MCFFQRIVDNGGKKINSNRVLLHIRHNKVSFIFRWFNKFLMHRFQSRLITVQNFLQIATSFLRITANTANKTFVGIRMNENFQIIFF